MIRSRPASWNEKPSTMSTDQNLLFGVIALQMDLLDAGRFARACTFWSADKSKSLGDVLVERGWIAPRDREEVDQMLSRRLEKFGGDARAGLVASVSPDVTSVLAEVKDEAIRKSLEGMCGDLELVNTVTTDVDQRDRYLLTRLHGEGGVGQVWVARDTELGREVALKELRNERVDSQAVRSRFIREAKITGQLQHPGIVPVYEFSINEEDDRPYYTMKLVSGRTLRDVVAQYHSRRSDGQAAPMELVRLLNHFVAICHAVDYAHDRGVIHRDLKTENVMVGDFGETVVLDWGLARTQDETGPATTGDAGLAGTSIDGQPADDADVPTDPPVRSASPPPVDAGAYGATVLEDVSSPKIRLPGTAVDTLNRGLAGSEADVHQTMAGQILGTPAYMSPEQAEGRIDEMDHRTDVYGLGAILYEILTGRPPFTGEKTLEVLEAVLHQQPQRPRDVIVGVPLPLDAICRRALEKNPADRYKSARELASDVERFLADESVSVLKDSVTVRLMRWARQHRTLVATSAVLLVAVLAGLGIVAGVQQRANVKLTAANFETEKQRQEAERQRDAARTNAVEAERQRVQAERNAEETERQRQIAEAHFRKARDVVNRYLTQVSESRLLNVPGLQPLRRDLLELAMRYHEDFVTGSTDDARLQRELGESLLRMGFLRSEIEQPARAIPEYLKAEKILKSLVEANPDDHRSRGDLLEAHYELGRLYGESGKTTAAADQLKLAISTATELIEAEPGVAEWRNQLARTWRQLGQQLLSGRENATALTALDKAVVIHRELAAELPSEIGLQKELAETLTVSGVAQRRLKLYELAHQSLADAKTALEIIIKQAPDNPDYRQQLSSAQSSLALVLKNEGRQREALDEMAAAALLTGQLVRDNPQVVRFRTDEGIVSMSYGAMLREAGQLDAAQRVLERGVEVFAALAADEPDVPFHITSQAQCLTNLGNVLAQAGKNVEAVVLFGESIDLFGRLQKKQIATAGPNLQLVLRRRAVVLRTLKRDREALADWIAVIRLAGRKPSLFFVGNAERARAAAGDHARAVAIIKRFQQGPAGRNPSFLLHVACVCSLSSRSALADRQLDEPARKKLAERYAADAVAVLGKAHQAGAFRFPQLRALLKTEPDLGPLRMRKDFQDLVKDVEKTPLKKQSA